jgi:uncharacterized protein (DUF305 family)
MTVPSGSPPARPADAGVSETTGREAMPGSEVGAGPEVAGQPDVDARRTVDLDATRADAVVSSDRRPNRATMALLGAVGALVLLVIGATAGIVFFSSSNSGSDQTVPGSGSVDAGFAQDMIVHHGQGVLMAHFAELNSQDPEIQQMAYDIEYTQTDQIGQMQSWLSLWGVPEQSTAPHMAWMTLGGHNHGGGSNDPLATNGLMPGMATDEEMAKLQSLRGKASDVYFLQLMIRHHQGGAPMMAYAAEHAANPVVRNFAKQMLAAQTSEIGVMTGMLAERGAKPLPFTAPELTTTGG